MDTPGTLKVGEPHPSSLNALRWVKSIPMMELLKWQECMSSCAIEGNRTAEVCGETLRRLMNGEPVSDRYLLGLAWFLMELIDREEIK